MEIINKEIPISKDKCMPPAEKFFAGASGMSKNRKSYENLKKLSLETLDMIYDRIGIKAVFSYYEDIFFDGKKAVIGGVEFVSAAFEQLDPSRIKGAYVYMLTIGDTSLKNSPVIKQLLTDIWGTCFVDAARMILEKKISSEGNILSDAFGPGFYGMDIRSMKEIKKLADGEKIGITLSREDLLMPEKSCAGIYFSVTEDYIKLRNECRDCKGTEKSCALCNINKENEAKCTGECEICGKCIKGGSINDEDRMKTPAFVLPKDFSPAKGSTGYGIAFDMGTTTVAGVLWDIENAREVLSMARSNPQRIYGADVISRISFIKKHPKNLKVMRDLIRDCLNSIISELCHGSGVKKNSISKVTLCGNTTMSHIFSGHDPSPLAKAPFVPAYKGAVLMTKETSGLNINTDAEVMLLPNISGHVGGDTVAGMLSSRMLDQKELTLFLDIGTNGEIVLADGKNIFACSTAAGPAFEGASIDHGMRAAAGAVEKVIIEKEKVLIRTIEGVQPKGICGSGIIDAVAQMLDAGVVNRTGRILSAEELKKNDLPGPAMRINEKESREFSLVIREHGEDIVLTQKDIREVQLAKGAISAGINIMLEKAGREKEEIKKIILAGAFGNSINKESAVTIGLLPDIDRKKIHTVGNAAGAGAIMALADEGEQKKALEIPEKTEHVELAEIKDFQDKFLSAMSF